ncbi:hypothetical protein AgCh_009031 [Apium graveolens]
MSLLAILKKDILFLCLLFLLNLPLYNTELSPRMDIGSKVTIIYFWLNFEFPGHTRDRVNIWVQATLLISSCVWV